MLFSSKYLNFVSNWWKFTNFWLFWRRDLKKTFVWINWRRYLKLGDFGLIIWWIWLFSDYLLLRLTWTKYCVKLICNKCLEFKIQAKQTKGSFSKFIMFSIIFGWILSVYISFVISNFNCSSAKEWGLILNELHFFT